MTIRKTPSNRWRAQLKVGREQVGSKTFDTKKEATAWLARERAKLAGGVDPRTGRERMDASLARWLVLRGSTVAEKTVQADRWAVTKLPRWFTVLQVGAVQPRHVGDVLVELAAAGSSASGLAIVKTTLGAFFRWAVEQSVVAVSPALGVRLPRVQGEPSEMRPLTAAELAEVLKNQAAHSADRVLMTALMGLAGLRWSEARVLRVGDVQQVPHHGLVISRAQPEGVSLKSTKSTKSRRVPISAPLWGFLEPVLDGRGADELLVPSRSGGPVSASSYRRSVHWAETARGRRPHDLRHTAACLWLVAGVDVRTVQQWLGHSSLTVTEKYLHHLGTAADRAAIEQVNRAWGCAGGAEDKNNNNPREEKAP